MVVLITKQSNWVNPILLVNNLEQSKAVRTRLTYSVVTSRS